MIAQKTPEYAISVSHIKKQYGRHPVLRDIHFQASYGECIGILGANGCGKSTLLSILAGARKPSGGQLSFSGKDPLKHPELFSSGLGYVPQENPLIEKLTVQDNLSLWYSDRAALKQAFIHGLPAEFGLSEYAKRPVWQLSGGMKKRLSIACALAGDPRILIMDEPTAALDLVCKAEIRSYLKKYLMQKGLIILTTHEETELALCTRVFLMEDGVLQELETPLSGSELLKRMRGSYE